MKLIIIVAVVVVLVGGAVGAAVSFLQGSSVCNDPESLTDPVKISECLVVNCKFDVSKCTLPCPMGYSTKGGDDPCPKSCKCSAEGSFEGDIQFYDDDIPELLGKYGYVDKDDEEFSLFVGSALYVKGKILWDTKALPSGRIPIGYKLDRFLTVAKRLKKEMAKASKMYSDNTCIDIEPYDREKHGTHYVDITLGQGCSSMVGYKKNIKQQTMSLQYGCHYSGIIVHEFLHTLGFYHEQSRPDRDDFVKIHLDRVKYGNAHNFQKSRAYFVKDLKSPYDLQSIMHYSTREFSKNGQPTITHAGSGNYIFELL
nr:zinc metalloproteinase nas-14-like [Ciona intestinalis]|eukprot:XP_002120892.2 zinc metalloproteinase nas-14-like [Ciona intestinalis]